MRMQERHFKSWDGTDVAYYAAGRPGAPVMVLANGLGGIVEAWDSVVEYFQGRYRLLSWDFRGLYRSGAPADPSHLTVADHVQDLAGLLGTEGVERAVFLGWSMGAQVALEMYRHRPQAVAAYVLVNGTYGRTFDRLLKDPRLTSAAMRFFTLAQDHVDAVQSRLVALQAAAPMVFEALKLAGFVGRSVPPELFMKLVRANVATDLHTFAEMFKQAQAHDAADLLPRVAVPTLIVTGGRDRLAPAEWSREMNRMIPGSEIMLIPDATHYCPIEHPEIFNLRVEKFLRDHEVA